ncbi:carbon monoxide dehydrogenase subunit G [Arthrobacter sp. PvP102]|uniref:SRPBCC family protein n=1 Tax=unclassified Arthrobacter TaxID=235627 RepID=UPI0000527084|nr:MULTISPECIES: SRPBCC family protein [unclassified Arthrobacter]ABK03414.1 carbon monoxide dehydrogenase subunit G [Arthrobacter sp. FB24]MBP1231331.1 carbon monoxide dehydrogenase subunit G [Arthrobacter sp. PvP103]MBP1236466.1 carbon monoxide dehydrogenase subunit G [Arthrobacter sp. PvP102]
MQIDSAFSVVAPIDKVWDTLMDFQRVAGCVPGAQVLNKLSDDAYQIGMKVKLGPVSMQYKGQMSVLERNAGEHRAVFQGRAQETRGQGTAEATVTLRLAEAQGSTQGTVSADLALSGKAAAMGKSVIGGVTEQMMALFAANLQTLLAEPAGEAPGEAGQEAPPAPLSGSLGAPVAALSAPLSPSAPSPPSQPDNSLNALLLAKRMLNDQLSNPGKLIGLLAAVAFCAYRLGRRAGLRSGRP